MVRRRNAKQSESIMLRSDWSLIYIVCNRTMLRRKKRIS